MKYASNPPSPAQTELDSSLSPFQLAAMPNDKFHRELHERLVNTVSEIYMLPDDEEEDVRLQSETRVLETCFASIYAKVDDWLKPRSGRETTRCLDIGSARGDWIDQTATRCKDTHFTGIDLCPARRSSTAIGAPRAEFEIHDANTGLERYYGTFDVVHARNLSQGIQRFSTFISEVAESTRPGGLSVFIEWDYQVYNASKIPFTCSSPTYDPLRPQPGFGQVIRPQTEQIPALVHFLRSVTRASTSAGSHISAVGHLGAFVQRSGHFRDVDVKEVWIPVVAKNGADSQERRTAHDFRPVFVGFLNSCGPLLLSQGGFTPSQLSAIEDAARIEVMGCKVPIYVRFLCVTAIKN